MPAPSFLPFIAGAGAGEIGGLDSLLPGGGLGSGGPTAITSRIESGPIVRSGNVVASPVAVNLGELIQAFSGPPGNGGYGANPTSRLFPIKTSNTSVGTSPGVSVGGFDGGNLLLIVGASLAIILLLAGRKK